MAETAVLRPTADTATKAPIDRRQVIRQGTATTRRASLLLVAAPTLILTTGCSAHGGKGQHAHVARGSSFRVAGSADSATGTVPCDTLIGQPVKPRARCGDSGDSASAGCYESGVRHGDYYWMDTGTGSLVYGRPGHVWQIGPKPLSRGEMATQIGC